MQIIGPIRAQISRPRISCFVLITTEPNGIMLVGLAGSEQAHVRIHVDRAVALDRSHAPGPFIVRDEFGPEISTSHVRGVEIA